MNSYTLARAAALEVGAWEELYLDLAATLGNAGQNESESLRAHTFAARTRRLTASINRSATV
jgi:hypothetical protein